MLVLDTDHLSTLQRGGPQAQRLAARLRAETGEDVVVTIVSVEEQLRGWLSEIHKARSPQQLIAPYDKLRDLLLFFSAWTVLPFDEVSANELNHLRGLNLSRVGPQDLRIAAIVLSHGAKLLSANLKHFRLIPGLAADDWLAQS